MAQEYVSNSTSATIEANNSNPVRKSYPQAYHTSRLLDFTRKLNEVFDYKDDQSIGN